MSRNVSNLLLTGLLSTFLTSQVASAALIPFVGGLTAVNLDPNFVATFIGAGVSLGPIGTASLVGLTATFPITGGGLDTVTNQALIEHFGSGLQFQRGAAIVGVANFLIDVNLLSSTGILFADASLNGVLVGTVPLFDIGAGLTLKLTNTAAGILGVVYELPDLTGVDVGVAFTAPQAVPEPSTLALFAAGALALVAPKLARRVKSRG